MTPGARGSVLSRLGTSLRSSPAAERTLVVSALSDSMGTGLFAALAAVFFTRISSLTASQFALGLSLAGAVGFVLTIPVGVVGDRFGARRTLIVLNLWRAAGFACYAFVTSFPAYLVVVLLTAIADRTAGGVGQAIVADVAGDDRRVRLMAIMRSVRNVGYAVGGLAAGVAIAIDSSWVFRGTLFGIALFYVLCAALLARLRTADAGRVPVRTKRTWAFRDRRYLAFTGLNVFLALHVTTLNVLLPLWILSVPAIPESFVAFPLILNTVIVSVLQLPATRHIVSLRGAGRAALASAALLAAACCFFAFSAWWNDPAGAVPVLLCGVLALTAAEMWQAASSWQISMDLAPEGNRAQYLSTFNLSNTAERVVGPAVLPALVMTYRSWGWLLVCAVVLLSGVSTWWLARTAAPATPDGEADKEAVGGVGVA
ncbi:MFS transporter [Streptomyces sp. NBC_00328]|uniref:MFS transporter n=1 Tax=Streptomyces sp. NBC_00328 TaxID=2903646 RepID=UPI002E2DFE76|nr:MFS transporter [Streptomyces sp. NBC_00328]